MAAQNRGVTRFAVNPNCSGTENLLDRETASTDKRQNWNERRRIGAVFCNMTAIERILTTGQCARCGDKLMPTEREIHDIKAAMRFRIPESYREFVRLGGLSELRINHRVFSPSEILENRRNLPDQDHVPFADNGCGDFYCWPRRNAAEPAILFADHEEGYGYRTAAANFTVWLEEHRF